MKKIEVFFRTQGSDADECCVIDAEAKVKDLKAEIIQITGHKSDHDGLVDKKDEDVVKDNSGDEEITTHFSGGLFLEDEDDKLDDDTPVASLPKGKPVHLSNVDAVTVKARWQNEEAEIIARPGDTVRKVKAKAIAAIGLDANDHSEDALCVRETGAKLPESGHIGSAINATTDKGEISLDLLEDTKRQG